MGDAGKGKRKKVRSVKVQGVGSTILEREAEKRKSFFEDHRKVVEL
jgi:hypothetical protein